MSNESDGIFLAQTLFFLFLDADRACASVQSSCVQSTHHQHPESHRRSKCPVESRLTTKTSGENTFLWNRSSSADRCIPRFPQMPGSPRTADLPPYRRCLDAPA